MSSASQPVSKLSATADNNRECENLNELISLVYDSVFDQSRWETAFVKIARYVGGTGAGLFAKDHESDHVRILGLFGVVPPLPGALLAELCPALVRHFLGEREQPLATSDLMPFDQLTSTESYQIGRAH